jgi:hypothetical protein
VSDRITIPPVDGKPRPSEPDLEHVIRSRPPWRRGDDLTECGKPVSKVTAVITRDAFLAKVRRQGQQRSAMSTCMTCWHTSQNHPSWEENPVKSLVREAMRFEWHLPGREGRDLTFYDELRAIEALIAAHPDEWAELLTDLSDTVRLDDRRRQKRRSRG